MTEHELLQALKQGEEAAFNAIFRAYYARMVRLAESMLGTRAPAEEIAQEVMLELWRRRSTLTVDSSLQAYLFRATRNRTLNYLRHEKVATQAANTAPPDLVTSPSADRDVFAREIDVALRDAIATLPPRCREVFELSRVQGLKYTEIADVLQISIKTVEAQMGKALRIIRERMIDFLP